MINPNWSPQSGRPPFPNVAVGILMKYSSGMQRWKSRQTQECGVNCLIGNGVLAVHVQTGSALVSSCVITPPVLIGTEVKLCMEEPSPLSVIMTTAEGALMKEKWKEAEILIWNNVAVPLLSPRRHKHSSVKCWSQPTAWLTWAVRCLSSLARVVSSSAPAATSRWRKTPVHACRRRHKRGRLKGNQPVQPLENQHWS